MAVTVKLKDLNKALSSVRDVRKRLDAPGVASEIQSAADGLRDRVLEHTPDGPTGNLRKAIKAERVPAFATKISRSPLRAYVYVDHGIAPHSHLLEFGTVERFQKNGKSVGAIQPARPFFRPGIESGRAQATRRVEKALKDAIER